MSSPERNGSQPGHEGPTGKEAAGPYVAAARFSTERQALNTYGKMQELVFQSDWDLSVYRLLYLGISHVAAIGEPQQPPEVHEKVGGLLAEGEPATLPPHVIDTLVQRRNQAKRIGPWVEGHYRPGRIL